MIQIAPKFQFFSRNYKKLIFSYLTPLPRKKNLTQACLVFVGNHAVSGLQIFKGISRGPCTPFLEKSNGRVEALDTGVAGIRFCGIRAKINKRTTIISLMGLEVLTLILDRNSTGNDTGSDSE